MIQDINFSEHSVFKRLSEFINFYESLSFSILRFVPPGTLSFINLDTYVYSSMKETLESIRDILAKKRINDAYTLLRKFYDAAIINIYTNLYLEDHFSIDNFVVEKIENWRNGKEKLPDIRSMKNYIQKSEKVEIINNMFEGDNRYSSLRDRCNDHTHYNFYMQVLLNNSQLHIKNRMFYLDQFTNDLEDIVIYHLTYLFFINDHYMMSSNYTDSLDCGLSPEQDSQYFVAPFIQDIFDDLVKQKRMDLAIEIKKNTSMFLE